MVDVKERPPAPDQRAERRSGPQIAPLPRIQIEIAIPPTNREPIPREPLVAQVSGPECKAEVNASGGNGHDDPSVMAVGFNINGNAIRRFHPIGVGRQMAADQSRAEIKANNRNAKQRHTL